MQVQDKGIIISILKHSESSLIVKILSENNGIYSGYVKGGVSKKNIGLYQIGNLVDFVWSSRNANNLGYLKTDLIKSYSIFIFEKKLNLYIFEALINLINIFIQERQKEEIIYHNLLKILELFKSNTTKLILLKEYVLFEKNLLQILGIGLTIKNHLNTTENLFYVSPKTGTAVSKEIGEPYKDKLFILPKFLYDEKTDVSNKEIKLGLKITGYFLNKNLQEHYSEKKQKKIIASRLKVLDQISY